MPRHFRQIAKLGVAALIALAIGQNMKNAGSWAIKGPVRADSGFVFAQNKFDDMLFSERIAPLKAALDLDAIGLEQQQPSNSIFNGLHEQMQVHLPSYRRADDWKPSWHTRLIEHFEAVGWHELRPTVQVGHGPDGPMQLHRLGRGVAKVFDVDHGGQEIRRQLEPATIAEQNGSFSELHRLALSGRADFRGLGGLCGMLDCASSGCCRPAGGAGTPKCQKNGKPDTNQTVDSQPILISRDVGRILSGLCGAPLLAKIGILYSFGALAIGFVFLSLGLVLYGNGGALWRDSIPWRWGCWRWRWPRLLGLCGIAVGGAAFWWGVLLSQTFARCAT